MILDKIISAKREEVISLTKTTPLSELKAAVCDLPPARDFKGALMDKNCAIIAEIKKRSPSKGILRDDFDHRRIASIYQASGASAISVLTDQTFFGGDKRYLSDIGKIVHLPLLRKDFIIDMYQVYETKILGGDALLLIAGILEAEILKELIGLTEGLGLCAFVEVHTKDDLDKALAAGATIIGINNRDLKTFSTDLNISLILAPHVPPNTSLISESGIRTRKDIDILLNAGIHAFLVGETLMRADNVGNKMKELLGRNQ
ncbi:MAG: indole-3-glycerol phosphate synthase TrpC [Deltaproteobacteria bacterium]|nr:indole-3-glycerol phosphate synthase TrpC [Deltaproteobacteria bacterium]